MDWLPYLSRLSPIISTRTPAAHGHVVACETSLGIALPEELRELLTQTDGVLGEFSLDLVWPARRIEQDNLEFRRSVDFHELYMPFDSLLFFGDAGNGDQFVFPIKAGSVRDSDIFVWNHEDDSRSWVAPSLERYFEWWIAGKITV